MQIPLEVLGKPLASVCVLFFFFMTSDEMFVP